MKKNILLIFIILILAIFLLQGVHFQSVDEYYLEHIDDITPESETVFISIRCDTILQNYDDLDEHLKSNEYVPVDGQILASTEYVLREGDTAFDILHRAVRHNKIQMEYQGADKNIYSSVYVQGINYLYEFSCGPLSGWTFKVNGQFTKQGCSNYKLKDGDVIEWLFTCNLGKDVGNVWEN